MPDFASIIAAADPVFAEPDVVTDTADETLVDTPWRVILFDDDIHTFEDVILQLKDLVYEGEFFECFRVQGVLKEIQLVTEIEG